MTPSANTSFFAAAAGLLLAAVVAQAQTLAGDALIAALHDGGHVIVMRHASASGEPPEARQRVPGNVNGEPQLDDMGRATATAMGYAFRELELPVGEVLSSPAFRAVETATYFGFGDLQKAEQLSDRGGDAEWLREKTAEAPRAGTNTVIITHGRNIGAAFGEQAAGIAAGEALIFRPSAGEPMLVGRMPIVEWAKLAVD